MRVVFMGTPEFAVPTLRALVHSRYEVVAVITQPERAAGRGQRLQPSPVKMFAAQRGIDCHQPARIRDTDNRGQVASLNPQFLVVAAYGQILPKWLLDLPEIAPVNLHASLLPLHRGAAPVAWSLLRGDLVTGVTTMLMEEKLDSGPILLREEVPIPLEITRGELECQLAERGARLLIQTLDGLAAGTLTPHSQDHLRATYAPRIEKEMAVIAWNRPALEIHNHVRAFNPKPAAHTDFRGQRLQILRTRPHAAEESRVRGVPGTFLEPTERGLLVACSEGTALELLEVQVAGRKRVTGREFLTGARLRPGELLFATVQPA